MSVDHDFSDPGLLRLALTHASTGDATDNERLEYLGDAALDLIVAEDLYRQQSDLDEGELTERKASVVSRKSLAEAARRMDLHLMARVGGGLDQRTLSQSVMANLYEAVLGAIYLDAGLEAAGTFVSKTLSVELKRAHSRDVERPAASPKQMLQEHCQAAHGSVPRYEIVETRGEAHSRAFLIRAVLGDKKFPTAWGRNRKEAERFAALEALYLVEEGA